MEQERFYDTRKSRNLYETETYTKLKSCGTFHISYVIFRERCCFIFYVASKSETIRSCSYRNVYSLKHLIKRLYICCSVFVSRRLIKRQRLLEWPLKTLLFGRTCRNLLIKDRSFQTLIEVLLVQHLRRLSNFLYISPLPLSNVLVPFFFLKTNWASFRPRNPVFSKW